MTPKADAVMGEDVDMTPTPPNWFPYKTKMRGYTAGCAGLVTLMLAFVSLWVAYVQVHPSRGLKITLSIIWGAWPPIWFLFEHYIWFDNWDDPQAKDRFREGRTLWAKLWAGIGAVLAAILFKLAS